METSRERLRGAALICAAALCWSLSGLFVRLIGNHLDGWTIAFWRSAFMMLAVGSWLFAVHGRKVLSVYRAMGWPGMASGLLLGVTFTMFILAITRTSVANAVVLQSAAPLASAVLGRIFLGERLAPPTLVAIVTAVGGVAMMFASALESGDLTGNMLALGVAILFGGNIVVVRAARGVDLVPATVLAGAVALLATLPRAKLGAPSASDFALLAAMGVCSLGLGLFLFMRGAPYLTTAQVGLLGLLEVILAPIWVWLAFDEVPAPLSLAGGAVVLSALVVHSALSLRRSKPPVGMA
jgi:drug/metabolite transporter (DMT)-like permease